VALPELATELATIPPSVLLTDDGPGFGSNPFAINGIGTSLENDLPCERCVTVLNHPSDKKPSLQSAPRPSPPALLRPMSISGLELFIKPHKRPNAHKSRAFELNNVLDFAERISFFWHRAYEKDFLGSLQNVLSSSVKRVKRFTYKCRQIIGDE
jgi:hypothetical protein